MGHYYSELMHPDPIPSRSDEPAPRRKKVGKSNTKSFPASLVCTRCWAANDLRNRWCGLCGTKFSGELHPTENKFHVGNGEDGKHYWLTPWDEPEFVALKAEFGPFDFDPCPFPLPDGFDGLTCEWGQRNYVNPPFGSIVHQGKKKGPTAWVRKAIEEHKKGKLIVFVYPIDKWVLMLLKAIGAKVRNLGDVRWLAIEDGSQGKGTGRHIACFILDPSSTPPTGGAL